MFGLSWSEMLIIAIVTLVLVGPQDLPKVVKAISQAFNLAQKMASEFRAHFSELSRELEMKEISKHLELPKIDLERRIEQSIDPDHQLRESFSPPGATPSPPQESGKMPHQEEAQISAPAARRLEMWEETENKARLETQTPSLLPPRVALRLLEEREEWSRPSIIPPMPAIHEGMRTIVAKEIEETN